MNKSHTPTYIIAEAGVNHNGDVLLAKKLVDVAIEAGVDAVKFQTFKAEKVISKFAEKASYQKKTTEKNESQLDMVKKLQLSEEEHLELQNYCKEKNITFLSTPFDHDSIHFLNQLGMSIFKIPSGEITNLPYLKEIAKLDKKIILSTGMANLNEIHDAINILKNNGTKIDNISILHATTEYPCPIEEVNLNAMITIKNKFNVKIGYSDHTKGIEIPIAAVALGASIIEKHFTLDSTMEGPDHKASLEPNELKEMVKAIRNIEKSLGDGIKQASPSEIKNIPIVRKSIVAANRIKKGEVFTNSNLTVKRPGNGISPMYFEELLGTISEKNYEEDELI